MKYSILFVLFIGNCATSQPIKQTNTAEIKPQNTTAESATNPNAAAQPTKILNFSGQPTFVYKTKADYTQNVPVTLSDDKSQIIAYPAPQDLYNNDKLAYPTPLSDGYLLDNRGINAHTAFLKMTYVQYSKLKELPPLKDLYQQIIDKDPFTDLCNCGNRLQFQSDADIDFLVKNQLKDCKRIK